MPVCLKIHHLWILAVATFALFAVLPSAAARAADELGKHLLQEFDDNGDGLIALAEVNKRRNQLFDVIDDNDDGSISREEFVRGDSFLFAEFDLNRDGIITPGEIMAGQKARSSPPESYRVPPKSATQALGWDS